MKSTCVQSRSSMRARPARIAAPLPRSPGLTMTSAPAVRAASAVPSVDPSLNDTDGGDGTGHAADDLSQWYVPR